jgi:hypothetical protein
MIAGSVNDFAFHPIILNLIQAVHGNFLSILTGHLLILRAFVQGIIRLFFKGFFFKKKLLFLFLKNYF